MLETAKRFFLTGTIVAGAAVVAFSIADLVRHPVAPSWFVFAIFTLLSGTATLRLPAAPVGFSISDMFTMTAALLFGPAAGTAAVAIDSLAISRRLARRPLPVRRLMFNATAPALAMWVSAHVFFWLAGVGPLVFHASAVSQVLGPIAAFATTYYLLNTWLIAAAIALEQHANAFSIWRAHFFDLWLTYYGGASIAALIIVLIYAPGRTDFRMLALILPLPLILYFTFKTVVDRLQEHLQHLDALNRMNLATVDTLAQAIDAKDQVTHGHIRRVQLHAVRLAQELGVVDEDEMRALEVAALLHDVGKLAVPEHILNKPAKLTPAEYERMKQHSAVGAQILSSINFPYPVVPIVRHHHEHWDGAGYPDGLKGTAIPIGARILSVVDCFDALTSDRPYRPKLSDEIALKMIRDGRGSMYDPDIVDAFIRIYPAIAAETPADDMRLPAFGTIADAALTAVSAVDGPSAGLAELSTIDSAWDLGVALATATDLHRACDLVRGLVERLMPVSDCVLYLYDSTDDHLHACAVSGQHVDAIRRLIIKRGQRLSGWVAANRASIVNSDAALDLGNLTLSLQPAPRTCLSVPLVAGDDSIGALTVYSNRSDAYDDRHRRILETIAGKLAPSIRARMLV
jgi:putative nucleotidyltransferase with HDIG domain